MLRTVLLCSSLVLAAPLAAQEFTTQDLIAYAQRSEEALLRDRQRLLAAEASLSEPLWMRREDGTVDIIDGTPIYERASFIIEMAVSMRAGAELESIEESIEEQAGVEIPDFLRDLTQQVIENAATSDTAGQDSVVTRARNRLIEAYRNASAQTRRETLTAIDQRLQWVREVFSEAQEAEANRGAPALYHTFTSTYGDIHWDEGYYGNTNKTLTLGDIREDPDHAVWIVEGRWGRRNDPDHDGEFEFWFSSACQFAGWWWYDNDRPEIDGSAPNWTGECAGP